ncbi:MAG: hypothetical protein CSB55_08150 [Candidatus Cloacimonadota bacterium]|nr:MAG: hypothetical protein CSB55_08150 [Candidatus Cloacimonadota bacterium]
MNKIITLILLFVVWGLFAKDYDLKEYKKEAEKFLGTKSVEVKVSGEYRYAEVKTENQTRYFLMTGDFAKLKGYKGITNSALILDEKLNVKKAKILESEDTRSFVRKINRKGFMEQFGKGKKIELVTGATITSKNIVKSILLTKRKFGKLIGLSE